MQRKTRISPNLNVLLFEFHKSTDSRKANPKAWSVSHDLLGIHFISHMYPVFTMSCGMFLKFNAGMPPLIVFRSLCGPGFVDSNPTWLAMWTLLRRKAVWNHRIRAGFASRALGNLPRLLKSSKQSTERRSSTIYIKIPIALEHFTKAHSINRHRDWMTSFIWNVYLGEMYSTFLRKNRRLWDKIGFNRRVNIFDIFDIW